MREESSGAVGRIRLSCHRPAGYCTGLGTYLLGGPNSKKRTASSLPGRKRRPGLEKGSPLLPALCFITIINVSLSLPPPSLLLTPPLLPSDPDPRPSPFGLVPPNSRTLAAATAQPRPYQSRLQSASLGFQASATAAVNRGHYRQQRAKSPPGCSRSGIAQPPPARLPLSPSPFNNVPSTVAQTHATSASRQASPAQAPSAASHRIDDAVAVAVAAATLLPLNATARARARALRPPFFLLELIVGFLAHSLALTADAFHMLNDIISLVIGLWAVVAAQKETTDEYTFGWVRAEILGAFFNAVFLIALCVSIILEALTRFVEPPEINNPKLILIVGCAGLFSNLLGFVVLGGHGHSHDHDHGDEGHDHDHAHGEHSHDHSHTNDAEEGRAGRDIRSEVADESGDVNDILPEVVVRRATTDRSGTDSPETTRRIRFGDDAQGRDESNTRGSRASGQSRGRVRRRSSKSGHSRFASIEDMSIHPASFRQDIIAASLAASSNGPVAETDSSEESAVADSENDANESSPLLKDSNATSNNGTIAHKSHSHSTSTTWRRRARRDSSVHDGHNHTMPRKPGSKVSGHSHADMGMNAMMLHVLGDALGNVGVIITALIIWLTDWPGKIYADPTVSLFITAIILKTSIPLTLATARVLLQATPENICIQDIRQDIERLPGVVSCHHIHVWQLSDTKIVARKCLHAYGIHSATIQPEFCLDQKHQRDHDVAALSLDGATADGPADAACLLECVDDCEEQGCCTQDTASSTRRGSDSSQGDAQPRS
ncbi:hypothetical protein Purlil1_3852 [Purpureocillium lilacinum]|uniref:Cation efflux protein transmembrane domain-containing protein n=1 Tax=Purpureocillium lilacinum TaxID=33203 RepID=A0ABR0C8D6_PURLI|nr:hypothetical protein Purlil1_3852 [Purpureocillium lilacinum]